MWINYQTYHIIEVIWNEYQKYHKKKYIKRPTYMTPPPISSMPTMSGEQSGVSDPIYLIPKLDEH